MRALLVCLVLVACGDNQSNVDADAGPDATPACTDCQLTAISPTTATTGETITLEGRFSGETTVTFPGGAVQPAMLLGANRATVVVPEAAGSGQLRVTSGTQPLSPVSFRHATFTLGLRGFVTQHYADRTMPQLAHHRHSHTANVVGQFVYAIGGSDTGQLGVPMNPIADVERAVINADSSLGTFESVGSLAKPRYGHAAIAIGDRFYVLGGLTSGDVPLHDVEVATITSDGTLGPFAIVPGIELSQSSGGISALVIGAHLYVFGELVERAPIRLDGSIGAFETVAPLAFPTTFHASVVIRNHVYVIGGTAGTRVQRATIAGDGSLGAFELASSSLVVAREGFVSVVLGSQLFVFGGYEFSGATVERATIAPDGSLGPFSTTSDVAPSFAFYTAAVVAGNAIYTLGGRGGAGPLPLIHRASIDVGTSFAASAEVAGATLPHPRSDMSTVVIGNAMYVIGGYGEGVLVGAVERASLGNGTIGPLATVSGVSLVVPRAAHASAVIGNHVYVFGGVTTPGAGYVDSVERAPINADGTLGTFEMVTGTKLATARASHAVVLAGNSVFVLGGSTAAASNATSVERAPINFDGSLGTFETVNGVTLATGRTQMTAAVLGSAIYVMGGNAGLSAPAINSIERAPLAGGTLTATFAPVTGTLATARAGHALVLRGTSVCVVGGNQENAQTLDTIECAPLSAAGTLGAFAEVSGATLAKSRKFFAATASADALIVGGGVSFTAGELAGFERAELR